MGKGWSGGKGGLREAQRAEGPERAGGALDNGRGCLGLRAWGSGRGSRGLGEEIRKRWSELA